MTDPKTTVSSPRVARVAELLLALDQAWNSRSWHGATFRGALGRVDPEMAAWRPAPGRPNVWEIAVHAAYWKYSVLRRLDRSTPRFPLAGSNWFARPDVGAGGATAAAWKADLDLLGRMHRDLRAAVELLTDAELETVPEGSKTTIGDLVRGVAFHDVHHGGQVQLLKKLYQAGRSPS